MRSLCCRMSCRSDFRRRRHFCHRFRCLHRLWRLCKHLSGRRSYTSVKPPVGYDLPAKKRLRFTLTRKKRRLRRRSLIRAAASRPQLPETVHTCVMFSGSFSFSQKRKMTSSLKNIQKTHHSFFFRILLGIIFTVDDTVSQCIKGICHMNVFHLNALRYLEIAGSEIPDTPYISFHQFICDTLRS